MIKYASLSVRQVEVLQWISDGCPDGVMTNHSYKTTAIALQSRRLVTISKKGGVWRATILDGGIYYLSHGAFKGQEVDPPQEASRKPKVPLPTPPTTDGEEPAQLLKTPARPALVKKLSPADQLIADLIENGGELKIESRNYRKYEGRVGAAIRFGKVPEGKQLVMDGSHWSYERTIRLQDAPIWLTEELEPVPIPETLHKPHAVVMSLQAKESNFSIEKTSRHRALLLVQALAVEANHRGYLVTLTPLVRDYYNHYRPETNDHFSIALNGHATGFRLLQKTVRSPHDPTQTELREAAKYSWKVPPKFDYALTETLSFELSGRFEHRQSRWTDSKTRSLEECLPQILQEVELRAIAAENERLAAIKAQEEKRRKWELAMEQAKIEFREDYYGRVLDQQVDDWFRANKLREYLQAMRLKVETYDDPELAMIATEWISWAENQIELVDPLRQNLTMPGVSEPKADDLRPFLRGLDPYGS
jgi:hypothetical protein